MALCVVLCDGLLPVILVAPRWEVGRRCQLAGCWLRPRHSPSHMHAAASVLTLGYRVSDWGIDSPTHPLANTERTSLSEVTGYLSLYNNYPFSLDILLIITDVCWISDLLWLAAIGILFQWYVTFSYWEKHLEGTGFLTYLSRKSLDNYHSYYSWMIDSVLLKTFGCIMNYIIHLIALDIHLSLFLDISTCYFSWKSLDFLCVISFIHQPLLYSLLVILYA